MTINIKTISDLLEDIKAIDIKIMDVRKLTTITDHIIICTGRSTLHVRSIAENVIKNVKKPGEAPPKSQGLSLGQWALVDLGDIVLHVMSPEMRDFYQLEKLWDETLVDNKKDTTTNNK